MLCRRSACGVPRRGCCRGSASGRWRPACGVPRRGVTGGLPLGGVPHGGCSWGSASGRWRPACSVPCGGVAGGLPLAGGVGWQPLSLSCSPRLAANVGLYVQKHMLSHRSSPSTDIFPPPPTSQPRRKSLGKQAPARPRCLVCAAPGRAR